MPVFPACSSGQAPSTRQIRRPPGVKRVTFLSHTCHIYDNSIPDDIGLAYSSLLAHRLSPHIRFVFLRPRVCLHLPSDGTSRCLYPWCSARSSGHHDLQRDLHPPSHIPVHFRLPVNSTGYWCCAPCPAHSKKGKAKCLPLIHAPVTARIWP